MAELAFVAEGAGAVSFEAITAALIPNIGGWIYLFFEGFDFLGGELVVASVTRVTEVAAAFCMA